MNFLKKKKASSTTEETLTKEERVKNTIMFVIMIVFFAFLALTARSNNGSNTNNNDKDSNKPSSTTSNEESSIKGISAIKNNNYAYIYTFDTGITKEKITGKIYNNKEKFTIINNTSTIEGARLGEDYLILENGNFRFNSIPSENIKYTNSKNLATLLELSPFDEKKEKVEYEIDLIDMFDIYNPDFVYDEFSDYTPDQAYVYYENENISKIELVLNNYQKIITNNKDASLTITLEYFDYNKQEDFDIK